MDDLISRKAALDALRRCQTYLYDARDPELKIELSSAEAAINNLPIIQPEKTQLSQEDTTSDTISRQAALNSPVTMVSEGLDCIPAYHIKELPSAQPEQLERCPIYDGVCGYPSDQCYDCPRHHGAQPEPHEGHWIKHESPDGGEQYECSRCGVLWEFNEGTPEDNEAYFCPKCGTKMKGEANE